MTGSEGTGGGSPPTSCTVTEPSGCWPTRTRRLPSPSLTCRAPPSIVEFASRGVEDTARTCCSRARRRRVSFSTSREVVGIVDILQTVGADDSEPHLRPLVGGEGPLHHSHTHRHVHPVGLALEQDLVAELHR